MAATRSSSLRALRHISKTTSPSTSALTQQTRSLRITPHVESSPFLTTAKPSFSSSKLQAAIDEASDAVSKAQAAHAAPSRQFNTSRSLKAVGDTSTIDFAYVPDFDPDTGVSAGPPAVRIPLLPEALYPQSTKTSYTKEEEDMASYSMRHEISTASMQDLAPASMHEVLDNNAIDFHGVAETMKEKAAEVVEETGEMKRLLNGLIDDIFGVAKKTAS